LVKTINAASAGINCWSTTCGYKCICVLCYSNML